MLEFLIALWSLFAWPYRAWKESIENSRIGASPMDRETLRFWRQVAILGPIVALLILVGIAMWMVFT